MLIVLLFAVLYFAVGFDDLNVIAVFYCGAVVLLITSVFWVCLVILVVGFL